jgi:hypothetical protein
MHFVYEVTKLCGRTACSFKYLGEEKKTFFLNERLRKNCFFFGSNSWPLFVETRAALLPASPATMGYF